MSEEVPPGHNLAEGMDGAEDIEGGLATFELVDGIMHRAMQRKKQKEAHLALVAKLNELATLAEEALQPLGQLKDIFSEDFMDRVTPEPMVIDAVYSVGLDDRGIGGQADDLSGDADDLSEKPSPGTCPIATVSPSQLFLVPAQSIIPAGGPVSVPAQNTMPPGGPVNASAQNVTPSGGPANVSAQNVIPSGGPVNASAQGNEDATMHNSEDQEDQGEDVIVEGDWNEDNEVIAEEDEGVTTGQIDEFGFGPIWSFLEHCSRLDRQSDSDYIEAITDETQYQKLLEGFLNGGPDPFTSLGAYPNGLKASGLKMCVCAGVYTLNFLHLGIGTKTREQVQRLALEFLKEDPIAYNEMLCILHTELPDPAAFADEQHAKWEDDVSRFRKHHGLGFDVSIVRESAEGGKRYDFRKPATHPYSNAPPHNTVFPTSYQCFHMLAELLGITKTSALSEYYSNQPEVVTDTGVRIGPGGPILAHSILSTVLTWVAVGPGVLPAMNGSEGTKFGAVFEWKYKIRYALTQRTAELERVILQFFGGLVQDNSILRSVLASVPRVNWGRIINALLGHSIDTASILTVTSTEPAREEEEEEEEEA